MNIGSLIPWREKSTLPSMRQEGFDPFMNFRREVQRMMDEVFDGERRFGSFNGGMTAPAVDVEETDKEMIVSAEMPGLDEKDIQLTLAGDLLTIKGEKKVENENGNGDGYYRERRFGSFARALKLPFDVRNEKVDATYQKGVLTVRVPKPADAQKSIRQIEVKAA